MALCCWAGAACSSDPATPDDGVGGTAAAGSSGSGGSSSGSAGVAGSSGSGGSSGGSSGSAGTSNEADAATGTPVGPCNALIEDHGAPSYLHLVSCTPGVSFDTNPPSGGNHYGNWAAFQNYDFPVPPGFLVHSLEHGAVVFWYNCPEGCADEVAEVEDFIDSLPEDPLCEAEGQGVPRRAILVPYPELESRWAASAWGWTLNAECFDDGAFGDFYAARTGRGREALCLPGTVVTEETCP
jgi:uncharacterized protein DUF3105